MVYYARVVFETNESVAERHEDFGETRRWIEEERQSRPERFHLGQIIQFSILGLRQKLLQHLATKAPSHQGKES